LPVRTPPDSTSGGERLRDRAFRDVEKEHLSARHTRAVKVRFLRSRIQLLSSDRIYVFATTLVSFSLTAISQQNRVLRVLRSNLLCSSSPSRTNPEQTYLKESLQMATTKARTVKLTDLAATINKAVEASAGRKIAGGIIIGRQIPANLVDKIDANAVARQVTKEVQAAVPDAKLTPKVIKDGGLTTIGFIIKPVELNR
jgi:hypothetical protein